jgi:hypothetical protein
MAAAKARAALDYQKLMSGIADYDPTLAQLIAESDTVIDVSREKILNHIARRVEN